MCDQYVVQTASLQCWTKPIQSACKPWTVNYVNRFHFDHNTAVRSVIFQVANLQHSPRHSLRSNDITDNFVTINHRFVFDIFSVNNVASWRHHLRHLRPLHLPQKLPPQQFPILSMYYDTFTELRWRLRSVTRAKSSQKRLSPAMANCEWKHPAKPSLECKKKFKGGWRPRGDPQFFRTPMSSNFGEICEK